MATKNRKEKIEDFLLDPEKVVFEEITELTEALKVLVAQFDGVDLASLEKIEGKHGTTPEKGVDYFTPDEIAALEQFIIDRMPKEDVHFPSKASADKAIKGYVADAVAKLPKAKAGKDGKRGPKGGDGSPDTGLQIIKKIRAVGRNQMLRLKDIRGMDKFLEVVRGHSNDIAELQKQAKEKFIAFSNPSEGGGGASLPDQTGNAGKFLQTNGTTTLWALVAGAGDMLAAMYDPSAKNTDAFDMDNMEDRKSVV